MRVGGRRSVARAMSAFLLAASLFVPAPSTAAPTRLCRTADPFAGETRRELRTRFGKHVTVAVFDHRSACRYGLKRSKQVKTASIFKVSMMGNVALHASAEDRWLTAWEQVEITEMISWSSNPGATALLDELGGSAAMNEFYDTMEMPHTNAVPESWGQTTTTADDQVTLLLTMLNERSPYGRAWRRYFWDTLGTVVPEQRWGVTSGVDEAVYDVRLKNGWAPSGRHGEWVFNSIGQVRDRATGEAVYTIAILSDDWDGWIDGIGAVEELSALVARSLT